MELIEYKRPEGQSRRGHSEPILTINKGKLSVYKTLAIQLKLETGMKFKILFDKEGQAYIEFLAASSTDINSYGLYMSSKTTLGLKSNVKDLVKDEKIKDDAVYNLEPIELPDRQVYKLIFRNTTTPNKNRAPGEGAN